MAELGCRWIPNTLEVPSRSIFPPNVIEKKAIIWRETLGLTGFNISQKSLEGITIGWDLKPCLSQAEISAMPSHAINKNINPGIRNRWGGRFQDVSQSQRFLCGDVTMEMGIRPIIGRDCRNCSRAQDTSQSKGWCLRAKRWRSVCQGRKPSQESRTTNALFQL